MGAIAGTLCMHSCVEPTVGRCRRVDVPWQPDEITTQILTNILHKSGAIPENASVQHFSLKMFGVGEGLMSVMYRLDLDYEVDGALVIDQDGALDSAWPRTLVAKLTPPQLQPRVIGEFLDLFKTEAEYYDRGMPQRTGMQAPRTFLAAHGGYGRYIVVMEDLAPRKCGNQLEGVPPEQAMSAVRSMARFHAKYRNRVASAEETKEWVLRQDNESYAKIVRDTYCKAVLTLDDERFKFFGCDPDDFPHTKALMHYIMESYDDAYLPNALNDFSRVNAHSQFTSTLIHGDFRGENIFFPEQAGEEAMVIDYQLVKEGSPTDDLAYFLLTSMTTEARQKSEPQLLQLYLEEARRCGAADLTMEEMLLTYQASTIISMLINVIAQKDTAAQTSEKGKMLLKVTFDRLEAALRDWKVLEAYKLRFSKMDSDGVTSKYTREEVLQSIPQQFHALLS